jgi:Tfp pilus assembly protein FimT
MKKTRYWRNESGWTAVELTLVAGIVVLLTSSMVPPIQRTVAQYRLDTAAYAISGDLQLAKIRALKNNAAVFLSINVQAASWGITGVGTRFLPSRVSFGTQTPTSVGFNSRGRSTATSNQTVTLTNTASQTRTIVLSPSGKITVN